jgi:ribonuclease HI
MSDIRKYFNITPASSSSTSSSNKVKDTSSNKVKDTSSIKVNSVKGPSVNIFTDGSSLNNGQKNKYQAGGMGVYIEDTEECISEKLEGKITNNIAELKACIIGINNVIKRTPIPHMNIYCDSEYVVNSITKWAINWSKNNWQKYDKFKKTKCDIKNKDIIVELYNLYNTYSIEFIHTKAHGVEPTCKNSKPYKIWYGNHMADKLAVSASKCQ